MITNLIREGLNNIPLTTSHMPFYPDDCFIFLRFNQLYMFYTSISLKFKNRCPEIWYVLRRYVNFYFIFSFGVMVGLVPLHF